MTTVTVSSKGWVVIPAAYRRKYAMKSGSSVEVVDYGGGLSLVPSLEHVVKESQGLLEGGPSLTRALIQERKQERKYEREKRR